MHGANCTTKTIFYELLAIINIDWSMMERHNRNVCDVKIIMFAKYMAVMIYSVVRTACILAQNLNFNDLSSNGQHRSAHRMVKLWRIAFKCWIRIFLTGFFERNVTLVGSHEMFYKRF